MKYLNHTAIAAIILLASCSSSLKVQVHSFDMDKMKQSAQYVKAGNETKLSNYEALLASGIFEKTITRLTDSAESYLNQLVKAKKLSSANPPKIMNTVRPKISQSVGDYKKAAINVTNTLRAFVATNSPADKSAYARAESEFLLAQHSFQTFEKDLASELLQPGGNLNVIEERLKTAGAPLTQGTYGTSIISDDMASFVAKAPEEYWNKYETTFYTDESNLQKSKEKASINLTKISTTFGNSDIAVKMDGPGNFVIKGVRLDADQAFRASFKVLNQGIKYLTYAAGIPMAAPAEGGGSGEKEVKIPEIENYEKNKAKSEQLNQQYQQLTDSFLKIVDSYKDDLTGSSTKRKNAIIAIKKAYLFYRSQLPTQ